MYHSCTLPSPQTPGSVVEHTSRTDDSCGARERAQPNRSAPHTRTLAASGGVRRERIRRYVNERIRELGRIYDFGEPLELFCECTRTTCSARLAVADGDFEQTCALGTRFLVAPGHEQPQLETVVEQRQGYTVVEER